LRRRCHAFKAHQPQKEPAFAQSFERQPVAVAKGARDREGFLLLAPPALDRGDGGIERAVRQRRRSRAKARAHGGVLRPEPQPALEPQFEIVDRGGFVEGGGDLRQRRVESEPAVRVALAAARLRCKSRSARDRCGIGTSSKVSRARAM